MTIPREQLAEIHRLVVLLLEVVNNAEGCVTRLQKGLVELIDVDELRKKIRGMQADILKIDIDADEALNGDKN